VSAHVCPKCGLGYGDRRWGVGDAHNCGWARLTKDRLRELETAERLLQSVRDLDRIERHLQVSTTEERTSR
jgi:hypothetical protein